MNDYGYDDDEKGICINMISTSHNTPQMNDVSKILSLSSGKAPKIANLWSMLGSTLRSYLDARHEKAAIAGLKKDFKDCWIELEAFVNQALRTSPEQKLTAEDYLVQTNQLLMTYNRQDQSEEPSDRKDEPDGNPLEATAASIPENIDGDEPPADSGVKTAFDIGQAILEELKAIWDRMVDAKDESTMKGVTKEDFAAAALMISF